MSALLEAAAAVVPDSIEPLELWRTWRLHDGLLYSVTQSAQVWQPNEPLAARCAHPKMYRWELTKGYDGRTLEQAIAYTASRNSSRSYSAFSSAISFASYLNVPSVEPPPGFSYALVPITHDAPDQNCSCGIYAADTMAGCSSYHDSSSVYGKVNLWGKVIRGDKGARAEFAYPSVLYAKNAKQAKQLAAYCVEVVLEEDAPETVPHVKQVNRARRVLYGAVAVNACAAALNLGYIVGRAMH